MPAPIKIQCPELFRPLYRPKRHKVLWGGRGAMKSWKLTEALALLAASRNLRILCGRELQSSIRDSVHRTLADRITSLGLSDYFKVEVNSIRSRCTDSEFLFRGLHHAIRNLKSFEGVDILFIEEAEGISEEVWEVIEPTIRKDTCEIYRPGVFADESEIWMALNPRFKTDPTYQRFILNPPPDAWVQKVGWQDNPWFPKTLEKQRVYMQSVDPEAYEHIWNGHCKDISDAVIFAKRVSIEAFETPLEARFFFGADWGFAGSPTVLVRSFIEDECLFIDEEAFGYGVELDETAQLFDNIDGARKWKIKADGARPETISYMRRQGFNIEAADKWPGSVEDGISHLKGFKRIVIHTRCKHMQEERRLYSYKVDKITKEVLPIIVDAWNHGWDAVRYSLDGYIQRRGANSVWARL